MNVLETYEGPSDGFSYLLSQVTELRTWEADEPLWFVPLHTSVFRDENLDNIRLMVSSAATQHVVHQPDRSGFSILHHVLHNWIFPTWAEKRSNYESDPWESLLRSVIQARTDLHATTRNSMTPLQFILAQQNPEYISYTMPWSSLRPSRRHLRKVTNKCFQIFQEECIDLQGYLYQENGLWVTRKQSWIGIADRIASVKILPHKRYLIDWVSMEEPSLAEVDWATQLEQHLCHFWNLTRIRGEEGWIYLDSGDEPLRDYESYIDDIYDNDISSEDDRDEELRMPGSWN